MAGESQVIDAALRPLAPGELIHIGSEALAVSIAPAAGGRIAQISFDGVPWLCGPEDGDQAAIAWGSYAMVPWAGRVRRGRFHFNGRDWQLPITLGPHAIHGVGFVLPWQVREASAAQVDLELQLPQDNRWPFGGTARQRITVAGRQLRQELSVTAGDQPMPRPVLGWHPWYRKPERLDFTPSHYYPRDAEGIALPARPGTPPVPWDDCFISTVPVVLHRAGQTLRLESGCDHWLIFDERAHATCVEPQGGPPDAFNLEPERRIDPGETVAVWYTGGFARQY
jgi:aldose 1-epimerase